MHIFVSYVIFQLKLSKYLISISTQQLNFLNIHSFLLKKSPPSIIHASHITLYFKIPPQSKYHINMPSPLSPAAISRRKAEAAFDTQNKATRMFMATRVHSKGVTTQL